MSSIETENSVLAAAEDTTAAETRKAQRPRYDVFISHSSKNKNIADAICANFERNGIKCWYAPRDIAPGESWPSAIKAGIKEASVFVLVFSENSNESKQVTNEVAMAYREEKTIIPFKISETQMNDDLEYFLNRVHWLDAVSEPLEKNIDELRRYAERVLGHFRSGEAAVGYTPTIDGAQIAQAEKPVAQTGVKAEIGAKAQPETGKKEKGMLIGGISVAALVVIALLCFLFLAGPSGSELMEQGLALYHSQYHGTEDNAAARELFAQAAGKGEADAYYYLGRLDERVYDFDSAMENYELGVEAGSDLARLGLGCLRLEGWDDGAIEWEEARTLFETALDNGCIEANYYMGRLTEGGIAGIELDGEKAIEYYKEAGNGDAEIAAEALFAVGDIYRTGNAGVEKDLDKAIEYYEEMTEAEPYSEGAAKEYIGLAYEQIGDLGEAEDYFDEAFEFYSAAADAGDIASMTSLGRIYTYQNFEDKDDAEAIRWFSNAAAMGDPTAKYNQGLFYENGTLGTIGGKNDYEQAKKCYEESARAGYVTAKYGLGKLYYDGKLNEDGVAQEADYKESEKWFQEAADAGNDNAMSYLGILYHGDKLGEPDYEEAKEWYIMAANAGNRTGAYNLGVLYENEDFAEHSYKEAMYWYERAAKGGHAGAMNRLGYLYYAGELGDPDYEEAAYWYEKAAEGGNTNAMYWLGYLYDAGKLGDPNYEEAAYWYEKAAEGGEAGAMDSLGYLYYVGKLGAPDYEEAKNWYVRAAEAGNHNAEYNLGKLYADENFAEHSYEEAVYWYEKAAESGHTGAMIELGGIYNRGYLGEKNTEEALKWYEMAIEEGSTAAMVNAGYVYQAMQDYDNALLYFGMAIDSGDSDPEKLKGYIQDMVDNGQVTQEAASKWLGQ